MTTRRTDGVLRYYFSWHCPITIKNNSKYTALDLKIINSKGNNISDIEYASLLKKNNHIETYKDLKLETKISKVIPFEELRNVTLEADGTRSVSFQLKIENPEAFYMPESLKNLTILIKYKSEENKFFYTLYTKKNGVEKNRFYSFYPFFRKF